MMAVMMTTIMVPMLMAVLVLVRLLTILMTCTTQKCKLQHRSPLFMLMILSMMIIVVLIRMMTVAMPTIAVPTLIAVRVLVSIGKVIQPPGFSRGLQHCGGKAEWLHTLSKYLWKVDKTTRSTDTTEVQATAYKSKQRHMSPN